MTTTTHTLNLVGMGPVDVTIDEPGEGQPYVLLHGGGGPDTLARFAELFATTYHAHVINPIQPGFGGTPRPDGLHSIWDCADTDFSGSAVHSALS